ncbi:hypothetical protein A4X09_0g220 [Tilletia walkeri]|uniref:Uncharacterized protein n=1 Tax=Tilletia walkeri TaxID=117179 RepID=A0A8X7NFV0_9BASI|nr:hypothetical protein A4X09_0g220 [Tilletia walkeri]
MAPQGSSLSAAPPRQGQVRAASPSSQESSAKRTKLAISNEGPPQSAVTRFFSTPELLSITLGHLAFEKIDLITLSQVSRRLRANVLPLLVESLNVPLTKAGQVFQYLEANPGLAGQIKYVRIWDDVAHHYFHRRHSASVYPGSRSQAAPHRPTGMWMLLGRLLSALENSIRVLPPMIELSFGRSSFGDLYGQLRRFPRVLGRLTALRIVDDFDPAQHQRSAEDERNKSINQQTEQFTDDIKDVARLICDVQDDAGSDTFRLFGIRCSSSPGNNYIDRESFLPRFRPTRLLSRLAQRIRYLSIILDEPSDHDVKACKALLASTWPELLHFDLRSNDMLGVDYAEIRLATINFCQRHPGLTQTGIYINETSSVEVLPHWVDITLPRLARCTLDLGHTNDTHKLDFARRHANLEHLTIPLFQDEDAAQVLASHPPSMGSLRFLRSEASALHHFLRNGTPLQHVQVSDILVEWEMSDYYPECLSPEGRPCPSLTGLEISVEDTNAHTIVEDLMAIIPLAKLPNLIELALFCGYGIDYRRRDTPREAARLLVDLLKKVSTAKKLRALRMNYEGAADLPSEEKREKYITVMPPKLEYVTWHVYFSATTHHYRVLRPAGPDGTPTRPRLQKLPASFRPRVDRSTGIWEDLDDERTCNTLFDHMGDEPVLKYP